MNKHLGLRSNLSIQTKYVGPTNSRPARIIAKDTNLGTNTVSWDYALDARENHEAAALALLAKYQHDNVTLLKCESFPNTGYLFIAVPFGLLP